MNQEPQAASRPVGELATTAARSKGIVRKPLLPVEAHSAVRRISASSRESDESAQVVVGIGHDGGADAAYRHAHGRGFLGQPKVVVGLGGEYVVPVGQARNAEAVGCGSAGSEQLCAAKISIRVIEPSLSEAVALSETTAPEASVADGVVRVTAGTAVTVTLAAADGVTPPRLSCARAVKL